MKNVYVVYESYSLDCKNINDEKYRERILKVFEDKDCVRTAQYILDRVKEQCDIIIDPNGKYLKETEKSSDIWEGRLFEDDEENMLIADIYYENEYQYSIYSKYVEVE